VHVGLAVSRRAAVSPEALAVFDESQRLSYHELDVRSNQVAHLLRDRFGLKAGDRVAVLLHNRAEVVELLAGVAKARCVYVGLNFRMDENDLSAVFENAEPRMLITEEGYRGLAENLSRAFDVPVVDVDDDGADGYLAELRQVSDTPPLSIHEVRPHDHAAIVYTSGTTGRPKGVLFDHAAIIQHATIACLEYDISATSRYLIQIPHNSSVNITIAPCLVVGAAVGFADSRGFEPGAFADAVASVQATHTFLVPTQLVRILDQLPPSDPRLGTLTTLGYGSSPISPDRLGALVDRLGPIFIQLYGMAEIASIGTLLRKDDHVAALGERQRLLASCGRPSMGVDVRVVRDDGSDVATGERGEVVFRGHHVMLGYYREPDRTADVLVDGWMHSGDIATVDDDGYLYIVDRKKNLIIRGGLNIAPTEIENVLYEHRAVLEAAVVGAPDAEWGERIVAVVALTRDGTATPEELLRWCRASNLATIKQPTEVRIVDALPKNAVGKIDKVSVRAEFWTGDRQV
jgi:fatty-acyl-CoA synthase